MRFSGISIKMFAKILILKKCEKISVIFCGHKFQDEENFKKIPCKR